jgi:hypothetical protein
MTPGTLIMAFFIEQLIDTLKRPSLLTLAILAAGVSLIALGIWGFRKWMQQPGH